MARSKKPNGEKPIVGGNFAVLGMDIVSFSKLHDDDQITAIESLSTWIERALAYYGIEVDEYRWSPAGDGGYLTFVTSPSGRHAIDVAFSILEKAKQSDFCPRNGARLELRLSLHSGTVREGYEVGRASNIWGMGINMAARVLSVSSPSQLLVSKQYYDAYIKPDREDQFEFGSLYRRTVKHKAYVEVMNARRHELGLTRNQADDRRWQSIGGLWEKTKNEYDYLIQDAMHSGQPIAAIAAAKFLLDLEMEEPAKILCSMIASTEERLTTEYPRQQHDYLSLMTPDVLLEFIGLATARPMKAGSIICKQGDLATSCFFTVAGTVEVDLPGRSIRLPPGSLIGEFGLWIENIHRTATIVAKDDGLMLSINLDSFNTLLKNQTTVAGRLYDTVKLRILDNVFRSERLFPIEAAKLSQACRIEPPTCHKYSIGEELDLTTHAYILFCGKIEIEPPGGLTRSFVATGDISKVPVIGILSSFGCPDGTVATVRNSAVAVRISHEVLREVQKLAPVKHAWDALHGQRLGEIQQGQDTPV